MIPHSLAQESDAAAMSDGQRRWYLFMLFMGAAFNLFDRQIINILAQDIKTDLAISDAQLGLLTGTAFGIFYALFGLPLGRLGDRVDRIRLIAAALTLWSSFTILCGLAANFFQLFLTRIGVGIGEAASQPASTSLIPDIFPEKRRVTAMAILLVGGSAGSFFGLMFGGYAAARWGWRTAFMVAGAPGIALALVMILSMRDPRATKAARTYPSLRDSLNAVLGSARFRWLSLALLCSSLTVYAASAWLPPFFIRSHGLAVQQVGGLAAITVGVGGAIGTLGIGILSDRLRPWVDGIEFKLVMLAFALGVPLLLLTILAPSLPLAIVGWFLFNVCAFAFQAPTISLMQRAVPAGERAMAIAIASAFAVILAQGAGLPLVGLTSDALAGLGPTAIGVALLAWLSLAAVIGIAAHSRAHRADPD